ncbi:MAG: hypothetical protein WCF69_22705 [Mycobacterium sp.]
MNVLSSVRELIEFPKLSRTWRIYAFGMARVAGGDGIVGRGQGTAPPCAVQLNKLLDLTLARVFT